MHRAAFQLMMLIQIGILICNAPSYHDLLDLSVADILPCPTGTTYLCTGDAAARIEISEVTHNNLLSIAKNWMIYHYHPLAIPY